MSGRRGLAGIPERAFQRGQTGLREADWRTDLPRTLSATS